MQNTSEEVLNVTGIIGPYYITKTLGEGSFAKTVLAYKADGSRYALKIFDLTHKNKKECTFMIKQAKLEFESTFSL